MSTWRAKPLWLEESLSSIENQLPRDAWTYSLRIGVDGCEETSSLLRRMGRGHWFSEANVGPYVMRNSLIELRPAAAYATFDDDDVMHRDYLLELLEWVGSDRIAGAARVQIDDNGRLLRRRARYQHGVSVYSAGAWSKLGGFRAWPMAADHDLILRAARLRIPVKAVKMPLYRRRKHRASLTNRDDVGLESPVRREYRDRAVDLAKRGVGLQISPRTTPLTWREP